MHMAAWEWQPVNAFAAGGPLRWTASLGACLSSLASLPPYLLATGCEGVIPPSKTERRRRGALRPTRPSQCESQDGMLQSVGG